MGEKPKNESHDLCHVAGQMVQRQGVFGITKGIENTHFWSSEAGDPTKG